MPFGCGRVPDHPPEAHWLGSGHNRHQCLSAAGVCPTKQIKSKEKTMAHGSPMPFGCGRVPDVRACSRIVVATTAVTNAFRLRACARHRLRRVRPPYQRQVTNAFRLRACARHGVINSSFLALFLVTNAFRLRACARPITKEVEQLQDTPSPMPFGCGRVPDRAGVLHLR